MGTNFASWKYNLLVLDFILMIIKSAYIILCGPPGTCVLLEQKVFNLFLSDNQQVTIVIIECWMTYGLKFVEFTLKKNIYSTVVT